MSEHFFQCLGRLTTDLLHLAHFLGDLRLDFSRIDDTAPEDNFLKNKNSMTDPGDPRQFTHQTYLKDKN